MALFPLLPPPLALGCLGKQNVAQVTVPLTCCLLSPLRSASIPRDSASWDHTDGYGWVLSEQAQGTVLGDLSSSPDIPASSGAFYQSLIHSTHS